MLSPRSCNTQSTGIKNLALTRWRVSKMHRILSFCKLTSRTLESNLLKYIHQLIIVSHEERCQHSMQSTFCQEEHLTSKHLFQSKKLTRRTLEVRRSAANLTLLVTRNLKTWISVSILNSMRLCKYQTSMRAWR